MIYRFLCFRIRAFLCLLVFAVTGCLLACFCTTACVHIRQFVCSGYSVVVTIDIAMHLSSWPLEGGAGLCMAAYNLDK